jgi:hypothetical protein
MGIIRGATKKVLVAVAVYAGKRIAARVASKVVKAVAKRKLGS